MHAIAWIYTFMNNSSLWLQQEPITYGVLVFFQNSVRWLTFNTFAIRGVGPRGATGCLDYYDGHGFLWLPMTRSGEEIDCKWKYHCNYIACINDAYRPLGDVFLYIGYVSTKHEVKMCIIRQIVAPRAGKMNQILRCDWLPERARWSYLAHLGLPTIFRKEKFPKNHIINSLLTKLVRSRWLDIVLVVFCEFMELGSVSAHKHALQRTWPISSHLDLTLGQ